MAAAGQGLNQNSGFGGSPAITQWTNVVVGVELNYIHDKFVGSSTGSQAGLHLLPADYFATADISSSSSMNVGISRIAARARRLCVRLLLPYLFGGVALGQAEITAARFAPI